MQRNFFNDVEAVLFDFEGTLVDFQWDLAGAVHETFQMLEALGFPVSRIQSRKYSTLMKEAMEMATHLGRSVEEVREKISAIYDRYDEDALTRWTLRPKAKDFLFALKSRSIKIGLVSNVGKKALEEALRKMEVHSFFDVILSRNDVQNLKPSGEGINSALGRLQASKESAVFVGDSLDDIHAARDAGLSVVILLGGENPKPDLLAAKPDHLARGFDELILNL